MNRQPVTSRSWGVRWGAAWVAAAFLALAGCAREDAPGDDTPSGRDVHADTLRPPVIFDNDMDFDDAAALAHLARLHKAGQIDLRLVTVTSAGAGLPGRAIRHTRCLLEQWGLGDVPVADSRRVGVNAFPDVLRLTFEQVLTDVTPGCTASEEPSTMPAEQALINALVESERPVTLIATGPLTNVAGAIELRAAQGGDSLAPRVSHVFVVGGALRVPGGLCCGLETTFDQTQTFNPWADPAAAQATLDHFLLTDIVMVGADASNHVPIRADYIARLDAGATTPEAQFVRDLVNHPVITSAVTSGLPIFWWDPLATVAATTLDVVDYELVRIAIVQSGPSSGRTLEVGAHQGGRLVRFGISANQALFEDSFLNGLNMPIP
ncbi:nucleoside hydrolase [Pyxidicoccus sp. MSG2]|uniref:nucleoside hydrolase n=1 Tax=Pyxidicoccus sp. MSG2 TaxID=2996790 RepID=UPI00226DBC03|nr:nucleoside hydrolase [Pyxidicoccus sp. MSG2]MCY1015790.1 nucleoside hydrolase [Pyxidicoccus sp. MSG2]